MNTICYYECCVHQMRRCSPRTLLETVVPSLVAHILSIWDPPTREPDIDVRFAQYPEFCRALALLCLLDSVHFGSALLSAP
jgi:hypothetical protein